MAHTYGGLAAPYVDAIKGFEGYTPRAKWDYKQNSAGYGTAVKPGEVIDKDEAELRLSADLDNASASVRKFAPNLGPGTHAALTSLTFNAGPKWQTSGLGQAVQSGDPTAIRERFSQYTKAGGQTLPGLQTRRTTEMGWMGLGGPPPQDTTAPPPAAPTGPQPRYFSQASLDARRRQAAPMMQEGSSYAPVHHWTQGVARALGGVVGAYNMSQVDKDEMAQQQAGAQKIATYGQGIAGQPPPAAPTAAPVQAGGLATPPPIANPALAPQPAKPVQAQPAITGGPTPSQAPAMASQDDGRPAIGQTPPLMTSGAPVTTSVAPRGAGLAGAPPSAEVAPVPPPPAASQPVSAPSVQAADPYAIRRTRIQSEMQALAPLLANPATADFARARVTALTGELDGMDDPQKRLALAQAQQTLDQEKRQFKQVGTDMLGNPQYGFVDPVTQQVTPVAAPHGAGGSSAVGSALHGEEFLKTLDPAIADEIKGYAEGRIPYSPTMASKPRGMALTKLIMQYDPSFDAINYASRNSTRRDFTSGASAKNITSFNTAIGHIQHLSDAVEGLNNSGYPLWNTAANAVARNTSPDFAAREKKFMTARMAVAEELAKAFKGTGATNLEELHAWQQAINSADSPQALKASIQEAMRLLKSRIDSLGEQYNRGMGTTKDPIELLAPEARAAWGKLSGGGGGHGQPSLQPGHVESGYRFKGGNPADPASWDKVN